jgi:hypothetical protein
MKFRKYAILVSFLKKLKKMPYWYAKNNNFRIWHIGIQKIIKNLEDKKG